MFLSKLFFVDWCPVNSDHYYLYCFYILICLICFTLPTRQIINKIPPEHHLTMWVNYSKNSGGTTISWRRAGNSLCRGSSSTRRASRRPTERQSPNVSHAITSRERTNRPLDARIDSETYRRRFALVSHRRGNERRNAGGGNGYDISLC